MYYEEAFTLGGVVEPLGTGQSIYCHMQHWQILLSLGYLLSANPLETTQL